MKDSLNESPFIRATLSVLLQGNLSFHRLPHLSIKKWFFSNMEIILNIFSNASPDSASDSQKTNNTNIFTYFYQSSDARD